MTLTKREELIHYIGYCLGTVVRVPAGASEEEYKIKIGLVIEEICREFGLNDEQIKELNEELMKTDIYGYTEKAAQKLLEKYGKK